MKKVTLMIFTLMLAITFAVYAEETDNTALKTQDQVREYLKVQEKLHKEEQVLLKEQDKLEQKIKDMAKLQDRLQDRKQDMIKKKDQLQDKEQDKLQKKIRDMTKEQAQLQEKKQDMVRGMIEKTRGELAVASCERSIEYRTDEFRGILDKINGSKKKKDDKKDDADLNIDNVW